MKSINDRLSILEKKIGINEDYAHPTRLDIYKAVKILELITDLLN